MAASLKGCGFDGFGQFDVRLLKSIPSDISSIVSNKVCKSRYKMPTILSLSETPELINVSCNWNDTFLYVRGKSWQASYCSTAWYETLLAVTNAVPQDHMICNVWRCGSDVLVKATNELVLNVKDVKEIKELYRLEGCACCHGGQSYFLLPGGKVYVREHRADFCHMKEMEFIKVAKLSCGSDHALFVADNGAVYSRGVGTRGQLGHGELLPRAGPCIIEALWGVAIKDIACGLWHSVALSSCGDVYSWGWNKDGQLGHSSDSHVVMLPQLPELEVVCTAVSCGARHTAVVCKSGQLQVYGWNDYDQTSCNDVNSVLFATCGRWSTIFLQK